MADTSRGSSGTFPEPFGESVGPNVLKLLVSDRQAGKLIGKHGSTVSQIGASCHVSIRVSASNMFFPNTTDRVVIIAGEIPNIESALRNVHDRIAVAMTDSQSLTLLIQSSLLTTFVGQGCANLHRAAAEFNVTISVGPKLDTVTERLIKISHRNHFNSVMGALLSLWSKISNDPATVANLQMNYDGQHRSHSPAISSGPELYLSGIVVEPDGSTRTEDGQISGGPHQPEDAHLAAASLLPFDEIKVDTDLLRGTRTTEADELICKICHTYFLGCAPKLTKCAHAFCGDCFESWIQVQPTFRSWAQVAKTAGQARLVPCPVCKTPLNDKTDIHLILSDTPESECVRMASSLRRLPLMCHNNPSVSVDKGTCEWEGTYTEYQVHAKNCILNFSKNLIEPNTTAPPESHSETKKERENHVSVVIPFTVTPEYKDTMSVTAGDRLLIQEDSETGWIYGKNFTQHTQGWIPDYCIKRYDAWFEELVGGSGKHVEKCAAIRDFDPSTVVTGADDFQFLALKEGEVFTVCERSKSGWNLVINTDGSKQGWVPDNRCKIIREGSDGSAGVHNSTNDGSTTLMVSRGTFVVRRSFEGDEKRGELSLNQGETVSVRQASDSGWTLGVVVTGGTRKEGWFPDWIIDRSIIDPKLTNCSNCGVKCGQKNLTTYVRVSIGSPTTNPILAANKSIQDTYGPICTEKCWEQWMAKHKNSKQILRR